MQIVLANMFQEVASTPRLGGGTFERHACLAANGMEVVLDRFTGTGLACAFVRLVLREKPVLELVIQGAYRLESVAAGGWLLLPESADLPGYWLPVNPALRNLDGDGHILSWVNAAITGLNVTHAAFAVNLEGQAGQCLDLVAWQLPAGDSIYVNSLRHFSPMELQRWFLWSSHTQYTRPADLYLHLVHGHIYENHEVWPRYWRVCSELDAYALYVTLTGLLRSTGKRLYDLLRTQVVFSVIARQADDGGWYHGEWTDQMESHYRLHAGAMHMLAAYFEETRDPVANAALAEAAAFAAMRTDRLDAGMWYLHDSLEESTETLKKYPFRYVPSRAMGKAESNLLVLNTHLDTNIAMERIRRATGDSCHAVLIASAQATTKAVLAMRPATWLYRPLFWAIGLTFLPTKQAAALPLPLRALKRIAWKYLIPQLPRIKAWFPRLVMPGGYIERDLAQYGLAVRYQPVNLMDLIRTRRLFDEDYLDSLLEESFAFVQTSGIKQRWKENKGKEDDSLGFWAEALYHLCLAKPDPRYRAWLAEAMIDLEDNGLGLSPSLLGGNAEAIAPHAQWPCPVALDDGLRLANLGKEEGRELLVVNPTTSDISIAWDIPPAENLSWRAADGGPSSMVGQSPTVPARGWVIAMAVAPRP